MRVFAGCFEGGTDKGMQQVYACDLQALALTADASHDSVYVLADVPAFRGAHTLRPLPTVEIAGGFR